MDDVGLFDDRYFLYYEDTDLSWRMRLAGWDVRYIDDAVAWHEHAASSRVDSPLFRFHNDRNRLLTLVKNAPSGLAVGQVLRYPLTATSIKLSDDDGLVRTRARAMVSFLRLLPHAAWQRRRSTKHGRAAVAGLLVA
jgi:GT2 family glycosyltransferase